MDRSEDDSDDDDDDDDDQIIETEEELRKSMKLWKSRGSIFRSIAIVWVESAL